MWPKPKIVQEVTVTYDSMRIVDSMRVVTVVITINDRKIKYPITDRDEPEKVLAELLKVH